MFKKIILSIFIIALLIINGFAYTSSTNLSFKLMEDTDDSYTYTSCINDNFNLVDDLFDNVSTTEFGYLDGVTSAIQTQFGLRYLKTEIDSLSEVETIYGENITSSTELATYCETTQAYYNAIGDLPTAAVTNGDTTHISTADAVYDFCETTQNYALNSELHSAVTIGTANGLSLSTQALSLQLATTDQHGALSDTDWDTFNNKAASGANSDITSMTGITTPLAANYGGTGVANAAGETITLTGGFALDMTLTAATGVTLPTSGTLATTSNKLSAFAATTSAELAGVISDETGTGVLVFGTNPTVVLPVIKGTTASDLPTYSAEFLDASDWTSTDWTGDWATGWIHADGTTTVLSQAHTAVNATKYQIAYTVTRSAGSFTITFGGQSITGIIATGAWGPTTTSTGNLQITPTSTFAGTIIISIKSITATSTPISTYLLSDETTSLEIRVSPSLYNTFIGKGSGFYNTTGVSNTFIGFGTGSRNTTGKDNSFMGDGAGELNTTGEQNTFIGYCSGFYNLTGNYNTFVGKGSGFSNLADNNTFMGTNTGNTNTTGNYNSFFGMNAGLTNSTGSFNSFMGHGAGVANTTGEYNVFMGYKAAEYNTEGSYNVFMGHGAGGANTTGAENTFVGAVAGAFNTDGSSNVSVGSGAGCNNTTGDNNTFVGLSAGRYQADGTTAIIPNNSVYVGYKTKGLNNSDNNSIVIGYDAIGIGANTVVLGNDSITQTILKGNVMIGLNANTPTARLHLPAGTATASTAPLKFTSGTLMNTAEAGAIEFLTDKYYATITTAAERKTLSYVEKVINTLGDTDVTPDVSAGEIFISQSNGAATAITDLDSPQVGKTVTIICGHATNPPSIADGGNFKMAGNWTSDIDDSITFFVKADNYYIEIARSAN